MGSPREFYDHAFLKRVLRYSRTSGKFVWLENRRPRGKRGCVAGVRRSDGYILIGLGGMMFFAHRLAWFYVTGRWPTHQIDHKNGKRDDNRWNNLREATHSQNLRNCKINRRNKSGLRGVYKRLDCNRWSAFINVDKKAVYLGLFKTAKDAVAARRRAAIDLHGAFARTD